MADNTTFGTGNNATPPAGLVVSLEEISTLNGSAISTGEKAQRVIPAFRTGDGVVADYPGNGTDGLKVNLGADNDVTVTSGNVSAAQSGNWAARVQDGVGNALTSKAAGSERPLTVAVVDSSGNHVSAFGGSGGTAQADESAFTPGTTNVTPIAATYRATVDQAPANSAAALHMTERRALHVSRRSESSGAELGTETNPEAVRLSNGTSWLTPSQDYQHDAPLGTITSVAGPILLARSSANEPTAVSGDDEGVLLWADRLGRLVVVSGHPSPEAPIAVNPSSSGNNTVIAAPGASVSLYIRKGSVHNLSASDTTVLLQDGAGGTTRWGALVAANGGGSLFDFGDRGWKLTANTLLNANLSAANSIRINVTDYYIAA